MLFVPNLIIQEGIVQPPVHIPLIDTTLNKIWRIYIICTRYRAQATSLYLLIKNTPVMAAIY